MLFFNCGNKINTTCQNFSANTVLYIWRCLWGLFRIYDVINNSPAASPHRCANFEKVTMNFNVVNKFVLVTKNGYFACKCARQRKRAVISTQNRWFVDVTKLPLCVGCQCTLRHHHPYKIHPWNGVLQEYFTLMDWKCKTEPRHRINHKTRCDWNFKFSEDPVSPYFN